MKKLLITIFLLTFIGLPIKVLLADEAANDLQVRLLNIYDLYGKDAAESCQLLDDTLAVADISILPLPDAKEAYYFLGHCHYQLKNLEHSVTAYKKDAELDPEDQQALLYAGNVFLEQSSFPEAEKEYREALRRIPGRQDKKRVRAIIKNIPGKIHKDFRVAAGLGYDDNVNSGPSNTTHFLYDALNYTLASDETPRDDFFTLGNLEATFSKALNPETKSYVTMAIHDMTYFSEDDYNRTTLSASWGYRKGAGRRSLLLRPFMNYQFFDNKSYQFNSGMSISGAIRVSDKINMWPYLSGYFQNFYTNEQRDAGGGSIGGSGSYVFNNKTSVVGSAFYTYHNADLDQYTYDNLFLGASVYRTLTDDLTGALGYNLQLFYYDDADPAFGSAREDDGHRYYVNFDYALDELLDLERSFISLNISYYDNNSNHSFQERERLFTTLKLSVAF